mmetsp:Transcript_11952/g.17772  ORF Transcript_11952/g.17772 Transcript_11952/m.17772 type:complete len:90 (+) Transcript_11952:19-288(+)
MVMIASFPSKDELQELNKITRREINNRKDIKEIAEMVNELQKKSNVPEWGVYDSFQVVMKLNEKYPENIQIEMTKDVLEMMKDSIEYYI